MRVLALLSFAIGALAVPHEAAAKPFSELAFANDGRIYSLLADGSARTPLVSPAKLNHSLGSPAWSPDGSTLAYVRGEERGSERGDDDRSQIMLRTGATTVALTPLRKGVIDGQPAWSPDGRRIAFSRSAETRRSSVVTIRVIARAGGAEAVVARSTSGRRFTFVSSPSWRPDGRALAYVRSGLDKRAYFTATTFIAGIDGSDPRVLVGRAGPVSWSPDGSRLAYSSIRDRNGERCGSDECNYNNEIYVSNADGSEPRRLTRNRGDDLDPSWSPDGSRILFSSNRNFPDGWNPEIYTIAPDGSCLTWLTNGTSSSDSPAWRPAAPATPGPRGCGEAGRRPLSEVTLPRRTPRGALWLGRSYRGLLLSTAEGSRRSSFFAYEDCGRFDPRQCPPAAVTVSSTSVCSRAAFAPGLELPVVWRRRRGAVVGHQRAGFSLEIYSGALNSGIGLGLSLGDAIERRELARAFRVLVPVGAGSRRRRLPAPRISGVMARKLRAAERERRRGSQKEAARSLRISRGTLRNRLRFLRALRAGGRLRTIACPRRR